MPRPEFLALDRRWLWATDSERDIVIRVDPRFGRMVGGPVRVPEDLRGIAAGRDGGVWVTSAERDGVTGLEPR
jgi:streptogramin lyase